MATAGHLSPPTAKWPRWDGWRGAAIVIVLLVVAPLVAVLLGATREGMEWEYIVDTLLAGYIKNTLIMVFLVSALTLCMALPTAWLVVTHEFPGRRIFEWALVLPLAFPTYVSALVYLQVPESLIPTFIMIRERFGTEAFLWSQTVVRYGLLAVVLASVLFPYVYLTARASFASHNRRLIEASRTLGHSSLSTFFKVALPLSRLAIVAGLSLVIMEVLNDYGAVNLLGVPTLADGVFRTWFGLEDRDSAIRLASLMTLFVLFLLLVERLQRGRGTSAETRSDQHPLDRITLGPAGKSIAFATCLLPLSLGLLYPLYRLGHWSILTIRDAVPPTFADTVLRSLTLASCSTVLILLASLALAFHSHWSRSKPWKTASRVATLGYAMPGAVVAVGIMMFTGWTDRLTAPHLLISGSLFALTFGYLTRFLGVAHGPTRAGMDQLCGQVNEASRLLGHRKTSTFRHITLPLLRKPLLAAGMLVMVDILKELPLTMILRPANFDTLATKAFSLAKEGRIHESALPSVCIVLMGIGLLVPLNRWLRRPHLTS